MKKLMMMAAMAAATMTAFAQENVVKEAKKLYGKGEVKAALDMLNAGKDAGDAASKAAVYDLMSTIQYETYSKLYDAAVKSAITHEKVDSLTMFQNAVESWENALKCDEFDQQPDAKGKVKPKYHSNAQNKFKTIGVALVQGGQYFYGAKNNDMAIRMWKAYTGMRQSSLFKDVPAKDFPKEPFYNDIVYYTAFLSYQMKNYDDAIKYANMLIAEAPDKKADADEIILFSMRDNCSTPQDSAKFKAYIMEQHKNDVSNERFFNILIDFHNNDAPAAKESWLNEEIAINPQNKMVWAMKGEMKMNAEQWDEAIEAFKKAIEIDPTWAPCQFNTGVCYNSKAIALNDQLMDKKTMGVTKENAEKVKAVLREGLTYLEKTRELDPDQQICHWAYPLYRIYYSLGDKAKMAELEALDPSLKQ